MIIHGDARAVLPTLDLRDCVVITDPPWEGGVGIDIIGTGKTAPQLWREVAELLGDARAVVAYQSALDPPLPPPPQPYYCAVWFRLVPTPYRGTRLLSHIAYVYGRPRLPPGCRVHPSLLHVTRPPGPRRQGDHPCPMNIQAARWLVKWFAPGARCVVDPFCGAGTIIRAAAEIGIPSIGIDADERWIPHAERALREGQRQMLLDIDPPLRQTGVLAHHDSAPPGAE